MRLAAIDHTARQGGFDGYCAVPIVHKSGEVARETHVTAHWWRNTGKETAVLLSADLLHDASDHNM